MHSNTVHRIFYGTKRQRRTHFRTQSCGFWVHFWFLLFNWNRAQSGYEKDQSCLIGFQPCRLPHNTYWFELLITKTLKHNIFENPFLMHGENMRRTSIPNFKSVRCVVFEIQRLVSEWYLNFICIDI
jgi:hypothetical protein